jgi:hypothetical protein
MLRDAGRRRCNHDIITIQTLPLLVYPTDYLRLDSTYVLVQTLVLVLLSRLNSYLNSVHPRQISVKLVLGIHIPFHIFINDN